MMKNKSVFTLNNKTNERKRDAKILILTAKNNSYPKASKRELIFLFLRIHVAFPSSDFLNFVIESTHTHQKRMKNKMIS